jgi:hypothetical protein
MSIQGRISKTKKSLYDAKSRLGNLERRAFTRQGVMLLTRLKNEIESDLMLLDDLKAEIVKKDGQTEEE